MTNQLTQCPHCQSTFRVTQTQLEAARGMVRCGSCLGLFSASINFIRVKPPLDPEVHASLTKAVPPTVFGDPEDEITLGDLNLDADYSASADEEDTEEDFTDEYESEDSTLIPDSAARVLRGKKFSTVEARQFLTYEEYQDVPALLDQLDAADAAAAVEDSEDKMEFSPSGNRTFLDKDDFDADEVGPEPDDEYHPAGFEEEAENEYDEEDADTDLEDSAELEELYEEFHADINLAADTDFNEDLPEPDKTNAETKPAWLMQRGSPSEEKAKLHGYLASLDDAEQLQPLAPKHLETLEEEPVLLAASRYKRGLLATTALFLLSLLLLATLGLQFVNQNLAALNQRNSFAPYKPFFCRILDCPPDAQATAASSLYSQELLIRTHPRINNALELSFIFRNDADTPQNFPGLELSFKDIDNTLLANRLFLPQEYLPPELQQLDLMPARSSLQIMLELKDPGEEAVNYTIAFRDL